MKIYRINLTFACLYEMRYEYYNEAEVLFLKILSNQYAIFIPIFIPNKDSCDFFKDGVIATLMSIIENRREMRDISWLSS